MAQWCTYLSGNSLIQEIVDRAVQRLPPKVRQFVHGNCVFMSIGEHQGHGQTLPVRYIVAGSGWNGDNESAALILLGEEGLLQALEEEAATIIAHEVAHAWRGEDVGHRTIAEQARLWGFMGPGANPELFPD